MNSHVRKRDLLGPALALAAMIVAAGCLIIALVYESSKRNELRAQVRVAFCEEIELLKKGFRDEAIEDYNSLGRTLRLLGIERTAEIEELARQNRDETLGQYAPTKGGCERWGNIEYIVDE